jgi:Co/Zn/Cd efflux system component
MSTQIYKSVFKVSRMDCAAEENLVRMRLEDLNFAKSLEFNLGKREVVVYLDGTVHDIEAALALLDLDALHIETSLQDKDFSSASTQRRILWIVLLINFGFFVIEITTGFISQSMGLVADSLDMLADALVYGMSLLAVGTTVARKKVVARWSGFFQLILAIGGFIEVVRRFHGFEIIPDYRVMIVVSLFSLIANVISLLLLQRSRDREAHIQASMIFTSNDIIINLGVITAGVLVSLLQTSLPDLIVGGIVFLIVVQGAMRILAIAK